MEEINQQLLAERDSLRTQNVKLWSMVQQLQQEICTLKQQPSSVKAPISTSHVGTMTDDQESIPTSIEDKELDSMQTKEIMLMASAPKTQRESPSTPLVVEIASDSATKAISDDVNAASRGFNVAGGESPVSANKGLSLKPEGLSPSSATPTTPTPKVPPTTPVALRNGSAPRQVHQIEHAVSSNLPGPAPIITEPPHSEDSSTTLEQPSLERLNDAADEVQKRQAKTPAGADGSTTAAGYDSFPGLAFLSRPRSKSSASLNRRASRTNIHSSNMIDFRPIIPEDAFSKAIQGFASFAVAPVLDEKHQEEANDRDQPLSRTVSGPSPKKRVSIGVESSDTTIIPPTLPSKEPMMMVDPMHPQMAKEVEALLDASPKPVTSPNLLGAVSAGKDPVIVNTSSPALDMTASPRVPDETIDTLAPISTPSKEVVHVDVPSTAPLAEAKIPKTADGRVDFLATMDELHVVVLNSAVRLNEQGKETATFLIAVMNGRQPMWRVQKRYSDFLELHQQLRAHQPASIMERIGVQPPDRTIFKTHQALSPSKSDLRRKNLEDYLNLVLEETVDDCEDILWFLSTALMTKLESRENDIFVDAMKEGYLTKKGRNFGQWKRRYFVLRMDRLVYFESQETAAEALVLGAGIPEKAHGSIARRASFTKQVGPLGYIDLCGARISKQKSNHKSTVSGDSPYRHALMITEGPSQSNNNGEVKRSIFCAESDAERDEWVFYLARQVEVVRMEEERKRHEMVAQLVERAPPGAQHQATMENVPTVSVGEQPRLVITTEGLKTKRGTAVSSEPAPPPVPKKENVPSLSADMRSKPLSLEKTLKGKGLSQSKDCAAEEKPRYRSSRILDMGKNLVKATMEQAARGISSSTVVYAIPEVVDATPRVFGVPLEDAVAFSRVAVGYELPAVVFRCIEYLDAKKTYLEEGIYRLSGSQSEIKELRQCFEREGDVALLEQDCSFDIHAVAGLFKLFLRELPLSILTNELHRDFLNVTDLLDRSDRIIELARLVSYLPVANYTLLRALVAHLITIVQKSNVNKMTAQNVGIVFSPTVGIPAGIFTLMMAEFEFIFWVHSDSTELDEMRQQFRDHQEKMMLADVVEEKTMKPMGDLDAPNSLVENTMEQESTVGEKRRSWRAEEVTVQGRSNRNSTIYLENAPESVKLFERLAIISKEDPEVQQELNAAEDAEEFSIDLQQQSLSQVKVPRKYQSTRNSNRFSTSFTAADLEQETASLRLEDEDSLTSEQADQHSQKEDQKRPSRRISALQTIRTSDTDGEERFSMTYSMYEHLSNGGLALPPQLPSNAAHLLQVGGTTPSPISPQNGHSRQVVSQLHQISREDDFEVAHSVTESKDVQEYEYEDDEFATTIPENQVHQEIDSWSIADMY